MSLLSENRGRAPPAASGPPCPAQLGRARARVGRALGGAGTNRFRSDRGVDPLAQASAKGPFDQTVLAAVEADDGGPSTWFQDGWQHPQQLLQVGRLAVDQDAQ